MRSGRLVRIWYWCCGVRRITSQIRSTNSSGTSGWNRSDMELTNTRLAFFQVSGISSEASSQRTRFVQTAPRLARFVKPAYLGVPIASRRAAIRMA